MAHDITNAAYSNTPAWHGLGTTLPRNMEPQEAFRIAGLDWTVEKTPLFVSTITEDGVGFDAVSESNQALRRTDNHTVLSIVSDRYEPFQNSSLLDLAVSFQAADGSAYCESALELSGGRDVVLLLKLREWAIGDDRSTDYLTLWNSHDGSKALSVYPTSVRVVCRNTLQWSDGRDGERGFRFRHSAGIHAQVDEVTAALSRSRATSESWEDVARRLAGAPLTAEGAGSLLKRYALMRHPEPSAAGLTAKQADKILIAHQRRVATTIAQVSAVFRSPTCSTDATNDTLYGVVNACTEHLDQSGSRDAVRSRVDGVSLNAGRKRDLFAAALELVS